MQGFQISLSAEHEGWGQWGRAVSPELQKVRFLPLLLLLLIIVSISSTSVTPRTVCSKVERIVGQGLNSYLMKWRSSSNSIAVRSELQTGISSMLPSVTQLMPSMLSLLIIIESMTGLMEIVKTTY